MRRIVIIVGILALAGCGHRGGSSQNRNLGSYHAVGVISQACMASGRSQANGPVCSCVQAAANETLNSSDQSRAAALFGDPEKAEELRMSGASFWDRYREFSDRAKEMCG